MNENIYNIYKRSKIDSKIDAIYVSLTLEYSFNSPKAVPFFVNDPFNETFQPNQISLKYTYPPPILKTILKTLLISRKF